jgi:hypothetical protein
MLFQSKRRHVFHVGVVVGGGALQLREGFRPATSIIGKPVNPETLCVCHTLVVNFLRERERERKRLQ